MITTPRRLCLHWPISCSSPATAGGNDHIKETAASCTHHVGLKTLFILNAKYIYTTCIMPPRSLGAKLVNSSGVKFAEVYPNACVLGEYSRVQCCSSCAPIYGMAREITEMADLWRHGCRQCPHSTLPASLPPFALLFWAGSKLWHHSPSPCSLISEKRLASARKWTMYSYCPLVDVWL